MRLTNAITEIKMMYQNKPQGTCYRITLENGKSIDLYERFGVLTRLITTAKKKKKGDYVILLDYEPFDLTNNEEGVFITQETILDNKSKDVFSSFVRV